MIVGSALVNRMLDADETELGRLTARLAAGVRGGAG